MDTKTIIIVGVIAVVVMLAFGLIMRRVDSKLHPAQKDINTREDEAKKDQTNPKKK